MKSITLHYISIAVLMLGLAACSSDSDNVQTDSEVTISGVVTAPTVTWPLSTRQTADAQPLNDFTLQLMQQLWSDGDPSIVASPLSLAIAISMVNEGCVGETRDEITQALGFEAGEHRQLTDLCASLLEGMTLSGDSVTMEIANACCVNRRYGLYEDYSRVMTEYFKAEVAAMDFSEPSTVADRYNTWCNEKTHGLVPGILDEDDIEDNLIALWLNAIYYKGLWETPFDEEDTRNGVFTTLSGQKTGTVWMPMMHQMHKLRYMYASDYAAIELPASGGRFLMTVVLPHSAYGLGRLLGNCDKDMLDGITTKMQSTEVLLTLPRFSIKSSLQESLMQALKALGIRRAFTDEAQITKVSPASGLIISLVRQNARIDVTEKGAEAAAVTVIGGKDGAAEPGGSVPITFTADHPFLYYITDRMTGLIAFIGIYNG